MDQEDALDFKALRAKFQMEDNLLKQPPKPPTIKPALPEKPKLVPPPPQSPAHYLPAGARPSLLTSINQNLDARTAGAPRVIFKEDKKESKMPLIQLNTKGKDKSEAKLKKPKEKKAKPEEDQKEEQKQKVVKEKKLPLIPVAPKESTPELVQAPPPPKVSPKKKGFLGFRKTSKSDLKEVHADPILDTPSVDVSGPTPLIPTPVIPAPVIPAPVIPAPVIPTPVIPAPVIPAPVIPAPLIPAPSGFGDIPPEPDFSAPRALLPNIPTVPDSSAAPVEITPPSTIPASPDFSPPPAFIPDVPTPSVTTPESEIPPLLKTPLMPILRPASPNDSLHGPPSATPTPPPSRAFKRPPTVASILAPSSPEPEVQAPVAVEAAVETPPPPTPSVAATTDPAPSPPSPKADRSISALSALSRAEDMSPGRRAPCDQRIFNALAKARRKNSHPTSPAKPFNITPPGEDLPPSPTLSGPDFPPVDYEGNPLKPVNGFDHRQASPVLEGVTDGESNSVPKPLLIPPVPPKKVLPDLPTLAPAPVKPERPISGFIPETPDNEIAAPHGFTEPDEFDDAHSPDLQASDWGNGDYAGPDSPDGENPPEFYGNGMTPPGADLNAAPVVGGQYQHDLAPETSLPVSEGTPQLPGLEANVPNGEYDTDYNVYEEIGASGGKKKGKTDGGKKRKGPPKNPYAEAQQEVANEEKSKTGRFGKNDKKAAAEGPDEKELKKREKQRLEKEKKELKERQEREKKELKEKEKRENELKKKFKITGQEDAMYQAKVTVTTKGRKNDLPVNNGDIVSIIRTTNCPKGKWLARDSSNNYGYISVDHVNLDIEEMLKLGKKTAIARPTSQINMVDDEDNSMASRPPNHYPNPAESFTDDSEEWTADDEEQFSPPIDTIENLTPISHSRAFSMPDIGNKELNINHQHSQSDNLDGGPYVEARHEALQKLATFFHSPKAASSTEPETSPVLEEEEAVPMPEAASTQEVDADQSDMIILPPPDLYA